VSGRVEKRWGFLERARGLFSNGSNYFVSTVIQKLRTFFRVALKECVPQRLTPGNANDIYGTAEAVPFVESVFTPGLKCLRENDHLIAASNARICGVIARLD
jgi:hypothetical protein